VTLTVGDEKFSQKLNVLKDPHSSGSESDIQTQTQLLAALREEMNTIAESVNQIESVRVQISGLERELGTDDTAKAIRKAAEDLAEKLVAVEGKVLQLKATGRGQDDVRWAPMLVQKINYLASEVGSSDFPPTTQQVAVKEELISRAGNSCKNSNNSWPRISRPSIPCFEGGTSRTSLSKTPKRDLLRSEHALASAKAERSGKKKGKTTRISADGYLYHPVSDAVRATAATLST